jgi:hypothetical protein
MPEDKFLLRNRGGFEFNDTSYDRVFDLTDSNYKITLKPKGTSWRFGVRFGRTADIPFYHPSGRYNNPDFPNIELVVGVRNNLTGLWTEPNRLELGSYFIPDLDDPLLNRWEHYEPTSQVALYLIFNHLSSELTVAYHVSDKLISEKRITLPGFKYFKVFAWADYTDYEIDTVIQWTPKGTRTSTVQSTTTVNVTSSTEPVLPAYGIMKIRRFGINQQQFKPGFNGVFWWPIEDDLDVVKESDYSKMIKKSDKIIGFMDGEDVDSAIALLEIAKLEKNELSGKYSLEFVVFDAFDPYIKLESFVNEVDQGFLKDELRFFDPLSLDQFLKILNAKPKGITRSHFLPYFIAEGNHKKTEDQLEFNNDIESIASVMALKAVEPPLAIGLFGKWGSGKSFFMEKLAEQIDKYANRKAPEYIENVVQVKFNSWHYSDANLWASLISEIFNSLNDFAYKDNAEDMRTLTDLMEWTSLQKQAAEQRKKELNEELEILKKEQRIKREKLEDISGIQLLKLFLSDEKIKKDLSELNNGDIELIVKDKQRIDGYIAEVKSAKNNVLYIFRELINFQGTRWLWLLLGAFLIFIISILVKTGFNVPWANLTTKMLFFYSTLVALVSKLIMSLKPWYDTFANARDRLYSLKKTIESRETIAPITLSDKELELKAVTISLDQIDQKLHETVAKIQDIRSGKKLKTFIEEKAKDENYVRQLGMISWIRRDFAMLDKLLREQHESKSKKSDKLKTEIKLKIDRIVLYIDDLDRCNEDIVVKVLEAIHLLLTFPLFIVIVGVDPRWLNNALNKKMNTLFGKDDKGESIQKTTELMTNSYDYLEKIFQIPFAIKPINKSSGEGLIKYLMRNEMEKSDKQTNTPSIIEKKVLKPTIATVTGPNSLNIVPGDIPAHVDITIGPGDQTKLTVIDDQETYSEDRIALSFRKEELAFIQRISPLFSKSPRTINSYINIYRIIRSHRSLQIIDQSSVDEYFPVMLMLAVIVGYNEIAPDFIVMLNNEKPEFTFGDYLKTLDDPLDETKHKFGKLLSEIDKLVDKTLFDKPLYEFKKNLALTSRFSFRSI